MSDLLADQQPKSPTTTLQQDLTVLGQRRINMIWEITQAVIAITVTVALIFSSLQRILTPELNNAFFLIIGFYFSRRCWVLFAPLSGWD